MAVEVEERYFLENGVSQYGVLEKVYKFHKTHGQYPAWVILNPQHQHIGGTSFIPLQTTPTPAIEPLEDNKDIEGHVVQGYHVDIEYNERADEKTVICGGFAKIS
jgi:hypothetical protein